MVLVCLSGSDYNAEYTLSLGWIQNKYNRSVVKDRHGLHLTFWSGWCRPQQTHFARCIVILVYLYNDKLNFVICPSTSMFFKVLSQINKINLKDSNMVKIGVFPCMCMLWLYWWLVLLITTNLIIAKSTNAIFSLPF